MDGQDKSGRTEVKDAVAQALIWQNHVITERNVAQVYDAKYGFLKGPVEDFVKDDMHLLVDPSRQKISDILDPELEQVMFPRILVQHQIKVLPSPKPIPQTTYGMLGWRCADSKYWLERYGRYAPTRRDILKQLDWPAEALP